MPVAITSSTGRGSEIWVSSVAIVWYFLDPRDAGCAVGAVPALLQRDPGVAVLVVEPGWHLGGAVPAGLPRPETAPVVVDPFPGCRRRQAGQLHRTGHSSSLIWNSCRPNIEFSTSAARI